MHHITTSEARAIRFRNALKNIPFLAGISDEELEFIEKIIVQKKFLKDQIILCEEDTSNYMYVVYSGKVKVVQTSKNGIEQILAIHKAGEYFGEMALLDGKTSPATVIAMEETWVGLIRKEDFEAYILKNEKMLRGIINLLCSRLRESWLRLKVLGLGTAEQKVAEILKLMSIQHGIKDQRGVIIPLRLTHAEIAEFASVSRETVSRIISRSVQSGEIELLEKKYLLLKPSFTEKTVLS